jgi:transcriptional regulator with XRE-family HTH domain
LKDAKSEFQKKLRLLMDGRSRKKVAEEAAIDPQWLANYLSRGDWPRADAILRIARALDVDVEWLLDEKVKAAMTRVNKPMVACGRVEILLKQLEVELKRAGITVSAVHIVAGVKK